LSTKTEELFNLITWSSPGLDDTTTSLEDKSTRNKYAKSSNAFVLFVLIFFLLENLDEKEDQTLAPLGIIQGLLIKLKVFKLEMLVWFILHDMCKL